MRVLLCGGIQCLGAGCGEELCIYTWQVDLPPGRMVNCTSMHNSVSCKKKQWNVGTKIEVGHCNPFEEWLRAHRRDTALMLPQASAAPQLARPFKHSWVHRLWQASFQAGTWWGTTHTDRWQAALQASRPAVQYHARVSGWVSGGGGEAYKRGS